MSSGKLALITGANGMDAKTLTHLLLSKGYHVILTYRRNSLLSLHDIYMLFFEDLKSNPDANLSFEVCDITDKNSVEECIKGTIKKYGKIDELYLLAAMSHVGNSFTQKEYSIMANGQSCYYFLETLRNHSRRTRTYFAATSELAGNVPAGTVFNEETVWNPRSPYSIGKALGGHWVKFYRNSLDSGLFVCFGILFNHSNQYRTRDFFIRKCTSQAAKIALGKESKLSLGNLNFYRDEHFSDFGCEMMWKMLQLPEPEDFVIGNGVCHHGEEYLDAIFGHFNLNWQDYVTLDSSLLRPNEVERLISDPSKAVQKLGWKPQRMFFNEHVSILCNYDYQLELGEKPKRMNVFDMFPV